METKYIHEFVVLTETMNFSDAAEELFISQSSLSKHIKALETELGLPLFSRTTRSISLTTAGEFFLHYARQISELTAQREEAFKVLREQDSNSVSFGVIQNSQFYDLPKYVLAFQSKHPEVHLNMIESDEAGLLDMFKKKQFNIFTAFPPSEEDDYYFMPMFKSRFYAIYKKGARNSNKDFVTVEELAGEKLLLPARNSTMSKVVLKGFQQEGFVPSIIYEGSSIGCLDLVKAGLGVSLHSREFADYFSDDPTIEAIPVEPSLEFVYGLGYRHSDKLTKAEQRYLNYMRIFEY